MEKGEKKTSGKDWEELAFEVWKRSRRRLFLSMSYLSGVLGRMETVPDGKVPFTATDGENIYFNPMLFVKRDREDPVYVHRAYMHMILHCMFLAPFKDVREIFGAAGGAENTFAGDDGEMYQIFDLAADIYSEYLIDGMDAEPLRRPESDIRSNIYKELKRKCGVLSIENILREIKDRDLQELSGWEEIFRVDDHRYWQGRGKDRKADDRTDDGTGRDERSGDTEQKNKEKEKERNEWEKATRTLGAAMAAYGSGQGEERLRKGLEGENRKKIPYREFLRKFMRIRETRRIDTDSFDPGYYNYGMSIYGDMPLIEEPELKEEKRLGELFVAIDTSGSCSGGLIERFLDETLEIISLKGVFSGTEGIRVLLCDNEIRGDYLLKPGDDPDMIKEKIEIKGLGGTDFRPVFKYMRQLKEKGKAKKISGLLYFTDGYGIYPKERPGWKTAFVFAGEPDFDSDERIVRGAGLTGRELLRPPGWAMTNVL